MHHLSDVSYRSLTGSNVSDITITPSTAEFDTLVVTPADPADNSTPEPEEQGAISRWHSYSTPTKHIDATQRRRPITAVNLWLTEILSVLLAISLLVASFIILDIFDGQQTGNWRAPINLSAFIATLSTISRIALATVASEIISQDKWSWFAKPRALHYIETLDQASRGPWGSLRLLSKSGKKPYLLVVLIVALTSIAMGPFAQQAVLIVQCQYVDDTEKASIPNVRALGQSPLDGRFIHMNLDYVLKPPVSPAQVAYESEFAFNAAAEAAIIAMLVNPAANDSTISVHCPTGNCNFRRLEDANKRQFTHRAPGICSNCVDITPSLQHNRSVQFLSPSKYLPGRYEKNLR